MEGSRDGERRDGRVENDQTMQRSEDGGDQIVRPSLAGEDRHAAADAGRNLVRCSGIIEEARAFVRGQFYGPEPVVIAPKLYDASSDAPILPGLRFAARIMSWEAIGDSMGSWMNLIWFAEIDDEKSIKAFVEEALAQVDWKRQASGYSS